MPNLVLPRSAESKAKELAEVKRSLVTEVNTQIGAARVMYITTAPGQEMIYASKEAEALRYKAASPRPMGLEEFPFLEAELGITADSPEDLADLWIQLSSYWRHIGSLLEQLRLGTIKAISDAASTAEAHAAIADLVSSLEGLE